MLTQVVLQTADPFTLNIEAVDPSEILVVKSISGLTSPGRTLYMGEFAREGGYFQGSRANKLNPVISMKMNPNYAEDIAVSDIRKRLYGLFYEPFPDSDGVPVVLKDDREPDRYFVGYCEDINTDQWVQDQTAMVSLVSTDSYLRSVDKVSEVNPGGWISKPFTYEGTASTGIEVTLKVVSNTPEVNFYMNGPKPMTLTRSFVAGDVIYISTIEGSRAVKVNGVDRMAALAPGPWIQLNRKNNVMSSYGTTEGDGKAVITKYEYRAAWWGI